jgi:hypothetical protein
MRSGAIRQRLAGVYFVYKSFPRVGGVVHKMDVVDFLEMIEKK